MSVADYHETKEVFKERRGKQSLFLLSLRLFRSRGKIDVNPVFRSSVLVTQFLALCSFFFSLGTTLNTLSKALFHNLLASGIRAHRLGMSHLGFAIVGFNLFYPGFGHNAWLPTTGTNICG